MWERKRKNERGRDRDEHQHAHIPVECRCLCAYLCVRVYVRETEIVTYVCIGMHTNTHAFKQQLLCTLECMHNLPNVCVQMSAC